MPYLIINGLMIVGILVFLFLMSWRLTLYILLPIPLLLAWGVFFWRRMRRYFHKWDQRWVRPNVYGERNLVRYSRGKGIRTGNAGGRLV